MGANNQKRHPSTRPPKLWIDQGGGIKPHEFGSASCEKGCKTKGSFFGKARPSRALRKTKDREWHGSDKRDPDSPLESRDRRTLSNLAQSLRLNSPVVSSLQRDLRTYVPPKSWIPCTSNKEWNTAIREFLSNEVDGWFWQADITGRNSFFSIIESMVDGATLDGDSHLGLVAPARLRRRSDHLLLQHLEGCRLGHPEGTQSVPSFGQERVNGLPPKLPVSRCKDYRNGYECDSVGKIVKAHIWKRKCSNDLLKAFGSGWEYDRAFADQNFRSLRAPGQANEYRGRSEYESAINSIIDQLETIEGVSRIVKFASKLGGIATTEDGEVPWGDDPDVDCPSCEGAGCNSCCPDRDPVPDILKTNGGMEIWSVKAGEKFEQFKNEIPNATFSGFMDCLVMQAAMSIHLPPMYAYVKGRLQGTDLRIELKRAAREFARRQCQLEREVMNYTLFQALGRARQMAISGARGLPETTRALAQIPAREITKGFWAYGEPVTADDKYQHNILMERIKMGLMTVDEYIVTYTGGDPDKHFDGIKQNATRLLTMAVEVADAVELATGKCIDWREAMALIRENGMPSLDAEDLSRDTLKIDEQTEQIEGLEQFSNFLNES